MEHIKFLFNILYTFLNEQEKRTLLIKGGNNLPLVLVGQRGDNSIPSPLVEQRGDNNLPSVLVGQFASSLPSAHCGTPSHLCLLSIQSGTFLS